MTIKDAHSFEKVISKEYFEEMENITFRGGRRGIQDKTIDHEFGLIDGGR